MAARAASWEPPLLNPSIRKNRDDRPLAMLIKPEKARSWSSDVAVVVLVKRAGTTRLRAPLGTANASVGQHGWHLKTNAARQAGSDRDGQRSVRLVPDNWSGGHQKAKPPGMLPRSRAQHGNVQPALTNSIVAHLSRRAERPICSTRRRCAAPDSKEHLGVLGAAWVALPQAAGEGLGQDRGVGRAAPPTILGGPTPSSSELGRRTLTAAPSQAFYYSLWRASFGSDMMTILDEREKY